MGEHNCLIEFQKQLRDLGGGEMRQVVYRDDEGTEPVFAVVVLEDDVEVMRDKLKALDEVSIRFENEDRT